MFDRFKPPMIVTIRTQLEELVGVLLYLPKKLR
jgi:hypothetical protein